MQCSDGVLLSTNYTAVGNWLLRQKSWKNSQMQSRREEIHDGITGSATREQVGWLRWCSYKLVIVKRLRLLLVFLYSPFTIIIPNPCSCSVQLSVAACASLTSPWTPAGLKYSFPLFSSVVASFLGGSSSIRKSDIWTNICLSEPWNQHQLMTPWRTTRARRQFLDLDLSVRIFIAEMTIAPHEARQPMRDYVSSERLSSLESDQNEPKKNSR